MQDIAKRAVVRLTTWHVSLALLLFLPAGSQHFWQAWIFWSLLVISTLIITFYFLHYNPSLIERRLKVGPLAEKEKSQKVIQMVGSLFFCALIIVSGLDHRFHWSTVPVPLVLVGDALVVCGFLIMFFVFKENSYASSIVQVSAGQPVISTGPYRLVRHPMYAGSVLTFLATPFALGSLWALIFTVPLAMVFGLRLLGEERYLSRNLPGYRKYCQTVRHRLIPLVR